MELEKTVVMDKLDSAAPSAAPRKKARREQHRLVVVGVDGGGTSTGVAVLDAATKELLSQTSAGPSNWCVYSTETTQQGDHLSSWLAQGLCQEHFGTCMSTNWPCRNSVGTDAAASTLRAAILGRKAASESAAAWS